MFSICERGGRSTLGFDKHDLALRLTFLLPLCNTPPVMNNKKRDSAYSPTRWWQALASPSTTSNGLLCRASVGPSLRTTVHLEPYSPNTVFKQIIYRSSPLKFVFTLRSPQSVSSLCSIYKSLHAHAAAIPFRSRLDYALNNGLQEKERYSLHSHDYYTHVSFTCV